MRWFILPPLLLAIVGISAAGGDGKNDPKTPPPFLAELLKGDASQFIRRFDKNKDGFLTKDELPPRLAAQFERLDTNGDGKLDRQEVERLLQQLRTRFGVNAKAAAKPPDRAELDRMVANILKRMDTDKDGKISRSEAQGPLAKNFDQLDTNKDGFLDKEELRRAVARFRPGPGAAKSDAKGKGDVQPPKPERRVPDFDALDRNADGRLTRDELKGTPYEDLFDQMDTNKDGKIDREEFAAYWMKKQP